MMGGQVANLLEGLQVKGLIELPAMTRIDHYAYIAKQPQGKLGPMHPQRVADYLTSFEKVRMLFS